ncbi:MAG: hypothetical protein WEE03_10250 [Chloroflexota bacterium]
MSFELALGLWAVVTAGALIAAFTSWRSSRHASHGTAQRDDPVANVHRSYLAGGHVYCRPSRADIDIEQCFGCSSLKELNDGSSPPYIVCERGAETGDADPGIREWWYRHHRRTPAI